MKIKDISFIVARKVITNILLIYKKLQVIVIHDIMEQVM